MSTKRKSLSIILKCIVIISAVIGIALSAADNSGVFMGGHHVFMFFTIQSNILTALTCFIGLILLFRAKEIKNSWYILKFTVTVSITLTGVVFSFVLAPTLADKAWTIRNILTHVVVPILSVVDFFVTGIYSDIKRKHSAFEVIPPVLYAVYATVGYINGWEFLKGMNYPYFFLNWGSEAGAFGFSDKLPFMGCVWWIIILLIFLIAVGNIYLTILNKLKMKEKRAE